MTREVLAVIPARGGSKGVLRKNVRPVAGKSLLQFAIEAARGSHRVTRIVVSTEDTEIAAVAGHLGCEVVPRPAALAQDGTPTLPVVQHVLKVLRDREHYVPEIVLLLQPTAPLRTAQHVDEALGLLTASGADSVVSVVQVPGHYHPEWQFVVGPGAELVRYDGRSIRELPTRRQALPATFSRNGAIYACRSRLITEAGTLYGDACRAYIMPPDVSVNVDSEDDLREAERRLLARGAPSP